VTNRADAKVPSAGFDAEQIDLSLRARPQHFLISVDLGPETVLFDRSSGAAHALNPTGALVWKCLDGESPLEEIVTDLADGFGVTTDVVADQVLDLMRAAGRSGLLEGVAPGSPEPDRGPVGVAEGEPVELPGMRVGRRTLLINWSAACGFCAQIVPELASLQPALDHAGIDIVLIDLFDPEATREGVERDGLVARVLGEPATSPSGDPFAGMGTPVAYLLDADGRVSSSLAYGAGPVLLLARSEAGGIEADSGPGPAADSPRFLPVAGGACGPVRSSGGPAAWEGVAAYSVGEYRVGIRADSAASDEILARALAGYRLAPDTTAPANYSVTLAGEGGRGPHRLNLLQAGTVIVARSRSPRRILRALAGHLSCLLDPEPGLVRISAIGAVRKGRGVLLPAAAIGWLDRIQPPLARLGFRLVDQPFTHLDVMRAEMVVPSPAVGMAEAVLATLPDPPARSSEPESVPPGRYPLGAWLLPERLWGNEPLSPARAAAAALGTVIGEPSDLAPGLEAFVSMLQSLDALAVPMDSPTAFTDALRVWTAAPSERTSEARRTTG
jgi:hypothetical protein